MDTSRIVINTIDKSTSLVEETKNCTGFTVIKAPKGPITPIKLRSGSAAKIKDIFGVSSLEYPELFELEIFNKEYDTWVSAPYKIAEVPVAYVTKNGVFKYNGTIPYTETLEKLILGEIDINYDDVSIEGITDIPEGGVDLLLDTRYPKSNFNYVTKLGEHEIVDINSKFPYPKFDIIDGKSCLIINTGLTINQINDIRGEQDLKFKISGYSSKYLNEFELVSSASSTKWAIKCDDSIVGYIVTYKNGKVEEILSQDDDVIYLVIHGITDSSKDNIITQEFINSYLDQEVERSSLLSYWIVPFKKDDLYGAILPKYPSERPLSISFASFSELNGYSKKKAYSRNILKMTISEKGAFHDDSHPIEISGSLDSTSVDTNGNPLSFSDSNINYSNQELVYVYSIKKIDNDSIVNFNMNMDKYPPILLDGGKRYFTNPNEKTYVETRDLSPKDNKNYYTRTGEGTPSDPYIYKLEEGITEFKPDTIYYEEGFNSVEFHNIGWNKSLDSEYSDVDVFFDSALHTDSSLSTLRNNDIFFQLANQDKNSHQLAGYFFNYTPTHTPSTLNEQLTFGRNYWNVCNIAVMDLDDGSRIFSPMTGARALMQCRIIENRWGGVAPMWENSGTPSMGGQLDMIYPYRLKYKYTKSDLDAYDLYNYNPVINDRQYGIMVVGQKTCKSGEVTDWSYIGHVSAFFNFLKIVRENVMVPQIGKPNNPYYRTLRKQQVEQYLEERLIGSNRIWAEASVDTSTADGVNDVYAQKARKFVINVSVKVDTFSETVELNFTNEDQSTTISGY